MGVVWARDSESNEWGNTSPFPRTRTVSRVCQGDKEGYSGNPHHFTDVDDPRFAKLKAVEKEGQRKEFVKNKDLVAELIKSGVVYPTKAQLDKAIEELKRIAKG